MTSCRVEERDFRGWRAACLENDLVRVVAVPDIGGRIMAYDLGGCPYLYVDPDLAGKLFTPVENQGDGSLAAWKNYGGDKTWPAPQGWDTDEQWHGPPDPVLDTGRYRLDALHAGDGTAIVRMVSPDASPTGVQITRQATLAEGSTRVALDLSLRNVAGWSVRWSIWDVVQLNAGRAGPGGRLEHDPGCTVTAPINPHSKFTSGYYIMFGDPVNSQWHSNRRARLFRGSYRWEIGKVGLDSRGGWAAFHNATAGQAFAARYTPEPGAEYPDDGADVEFWTVGRGKVANLDYEQAGIYLMECEILSPLRRIAPGESTSIRIEWGACRCPGPVVDVTAGGCASRKLRAERQGSDVVRLTGAFGVFDVGTLGVRFLDAGGDLLAQADLGRVNPLEPVQLDRVLPAPAATGATKRLTTHLTVTTGGVTHLLASAPIRRRGHA